VAHNHPERGAGEIRRHPRVKGICIFRKDNSILVAEGYDRAKCETFYTPLGGEVEFGEYGNHAIAREVREEIGAEVLNVRFIGTLENIFNFEGEKEHEIVLVYEGEFKDRALYTKPVIEGFEESLEYHGRIKATWKPISNFGCEAPLYPEGLLELLADAAS
jgi:8-oxo-dGTP pyrophosphatase MutT (NUDIX family)